MVDIKGLDKARVLKALYDYADNQGTGRFGRCRTAVTVEVCKSMLERSWKIECAFGLFLKVDLSRDEFEESEYDTIYGEGAAQRAVDSIRVEKQDGGDTDKDADGGKKELSLEEKEKLMKDALGKIKEILAELPPDVAVAASIVLKTALPGPSMGGMAGILGMLGALGGTFAPPTSSPFGMPFPFGGRFG